MKPEFPSALPRCPFPAVCKGKGHTAWKEEPQTGGGNTKAWEGECGVCPAQGQCLNSPLGDMHQLPLDERERGAGGGGCNTDIGTYPLVRKVGVCLVT